MIAEVAKSRVGGVALVMRRGEGKWLGSVGCGGRRGLRGGADGGQLRQAEAGPQHDAGEEEPWESAVHGGNVGGFSLMCERKFHARRRNLVGPRRTAVYGSAMEIKPLVEAAWAAREQAYAPYSGFQVGAAVVAADGRIFAGGNIENLSYGLTLCAERVAVAMAVAAGVRQIVAVAVVADTRVPISPCGACRQVLAEFGVTRVLLANRSQQLEFGLDELLPRATAGILDRAE